jgi:uncharacterized protein
VPERPCCASSLRTNCQIVVSALIPCLETTLLLEYALGIAIASLLDGRNIWPRLKRSSTDLFRYPALALIGMSRSGKKFGNFVYRTLTSKGYLVYPIHPSATTVRGVRCYSRFSDLPEQVEGVLIVVPPAQAINAVRDAAVVGIRLAWLQQGGVSGLLGKVPA